MDEELAALEAEFASLQSALNQPTTAEVMESLPFYNPLKVEQAKQQLMFDVPVGIAKAGAGLADILSYPVIKGAQLAGVSPETLPTFGAYQLVSTLAEKAAPYVGPVGVQPETGTQELISFLSPSPLSKASVAAQAGTGLASYLGFKGAEAIAPDSAALQIAGAALAPSAATLTGRGISAATQRLAPGINVALGQEEALRAAAQAELLRRAGPEAAERLRIAQEIPELGTGVGGVQLSAAEIAQTPSLAQYQLEMSGREGAAEIIKAAEELRGQELQAALTRLGIQPESGDFAIALQDAADQAAKKQAASEGSILRSLGLTEEAKAITKTERGATLREAISTKMDDADSLASEAWRAVPKETKLDASNTLEKILTDFRNFDELDRADAISDVPKLARVLNQTEKYLQQNAGIITVGQLQGLRRAAGRAMTEASGKNKTAGRLMGDFRENLETTGLKYFYDQTAGVPGGLPGTAATATDLNALQKLSTAIDKTREAKQIFNEGVVGEITALRRFKPKLKTSSVIDRALKNPENASEIIGKFGKDSVEATELRLEMLGRLDKATNPTEFLGRNKDTLKAIFGEDYTELNKFAQQKGRSTGLEQFERITDTQIPNKIFADINQVTNFMKRFQGTELEQYARSKFITTKLTKSGNVLANLQANKKIAQKLFGADFNDLEKVLTDLDLSKSPAQLAKAASKGQSITAQRLTTIGEIAAGRGVINLMEKGGPAIGTTIGTVAGGLPGTLIGLTAGGLISKAGAARRTQMDKFVAEILANPSLIKFAAAPPTEANVRKLIDIGQTLQRGGLAANQTETPTTLSTQVTTDSELTALETEFNQLQQLLRESQQQPESIKVGKQDVSIPVGEQYAPPKLVQAMIDVESSFDPKAVSNKGAKGLMQLMPGTAQDLGLAKKDIFDPNKNVEAGSRYMKQQMDQIPDLQASIAAYNWGIGNVLAALDKAEAKGKPRTWASIRRSAPTETQQYVDKVLMKYRMLEA